VQQKLAQGARRLAVPILLALFGTGLLYGEGLITPAISVLSAVEGLEEQSPQLGHLVIPIAVTILIGLFWVQRYGTGRIGAVFGWVRRPVGAVPAWARYLPGWGVCLGMT
jgi:KUP system potassium uptake protein